MTGFHRSSKASNGLQRHRKCRDAPALQIALYVRTLLSWEGLVLRAKMSCSNRAIASARLLGAAAVNARQSEARFMWGCITGRSSRWEGLGLAFGRGSLWARTLSSCHWWTPAAKTFSCCKIKSSRDAIWSLTSTVAMCAMPLSLRALYKAILGFSGSMLGPPAGVAKLHRIVSTWVQNLRTFTGASCRLDAARWDAKPVRLRERQIYRWWGPVYIRILLGKLIDGSLSTRTFTGKKKFRWWNKFGLTRKNQCMTSMLRAMSPQTSHVKRMAGRRKEGESNGTSNQGGSQIHMTARLFPKTHKIRGT